MSSVINRTTLAYKTSVNTPDYSETEWIINPDLSGVSEVPQKYWKIVGDDVVEMDQAEKDAVDAAIAEQARLAVESMLKTEVLPADYSGRLNVSCKAKDMTITTIITDLNVTDQTVVVADTTLTKYVLISLVYDLATDSFHIRAFEKTDGVYASLDPDEYLVQQDIAEWYVVANGTELVEVT